MKILSVLLFNIGSSVCAERKLEIAVLEPEPPLVRPDLPAFPEPSGYRYASPYDSEYRPRIPDTTAVEDLPGHGTVAIYDNFNWTVTPGVSPKDLELKETWNETSWNILDLLLIMDCTGSMSAWIKHSKTTLNSVIDTIARNDSLKVRVAFVGFRDFVDDDIFAIQDFTFDIDTVKSFISKQEARGGGDLPEDVVGALYQSLQLSWHPKSIKLASVVADAPTHGDQYDGQKGEQRLIQEVKPSPSGLVLEEVVQQLKKEEIDLTLYKLNDSTEKMYESILRTNGEDWVGFVDIREDIQEAQSLGYEAISEHVASSYAEKTGDVLSHRYALKKAG